MTYQEEVAAAASCLERGEDANWELARRTFENTTRDRWDDRPDKVPMAKWAADVRRTAARPFGERYAYLFKAVWEKYGTVYQLHLDAVDGSERVSWQDAYDDVVGMSRRERWQPTDATADRLIDEGSPELKAETAARLLTDPAVMESVTAPTNPISRKLAVAIDTQRAIGELDGILERSEGEPTERVGTYEDRVRERMGADAAMQHDLMMQRLAEYQAAYKPADVAEAISSSPHTTNIGVYQSGARMAIRWLQEFSDALEAQSRPRLVASQ